MRRTLLDMLIISSFGVELIRVSLVANRVSKPHWVTKYLVFGKEACEQAFEPEASRFLGADRRNETDEQYRAEMSKTDEQRKTAATSVEEEDKEKKGHRG